MTTVRPAMSGDAAAMQQLLQQLGYTIDLHQLAERFEQLSGSRCDAVLVADNAGVVIGLVALHWAPMLQQPTPVARITTLVVHDGARGRGVGHLLVEAAADLARQAGCDTLELTTALHRTEAHAFYKELGFQGSSLGFKRSLTNGLPKEQP